ncbi:exopolysaccharide biosynthesis protein [Spirulina sp. CCNP1310]|uniref:exopolysaccharide biosynthesis protein n=1 Tax=Spirulina sp. CCNP1310 TaxID=3110249 RepID=UPI002B1F3AFB|nr:exopolysaccharide biosynthesis protein [Spirulina sp. CCNP1310]MEA5417636.1 exopolysaccharide biosynthesis protein [Spirulina sp. CCNP1310]
MAKLSVELNRYFFEEERDTTVKLNDILMLAGERGFGFLLAILSLPSALPLPAPGYSTPFGVVIFLLALQFIYGSQRPWLPQRVANWQIKTTLAQRFIKAGVPWLKRLEAVSKPRFVFICQGLPGRLLVGIAIALMAISMMIPIPGTNTLPAMGIFFTAIGLSEDDGLIVSIGATICSLIAVVMISVIWVFYRGGSSILDLVKAWIKGLSN